MTFRIYPKLSERNSEIYGANPVFSKKRLYFFVLRWEHLPLSFLVYLPLNVGSLLFVVPSAIISARIAKTNSQNYPF
jgi:hypothetical protein